MGSAHRLAGTPGRADGTRSDRRPGRHRIPCGGCGVEERGRCDLQARCRCVDVNRLLCESAPEVPCQSPPWDREWNLLGTGRDYLEALLRNALSRARSNPWVQVAVLA